MTRTRSTIRPSRSRRANPWQIADYVWGFALGLALSGMAIEHGRQQVRSSPPPAYTLTAYPGP